MANPNFTKIKALFLDFDGVLTDNKVFVTGRQGEEFVICDRSDSLGVSMLIEKGIRVHIISKENNNIVRFRAEKMRISCDSGIDDKIQVMKDRMMEWHLSKNEVAFIGNDRNDISCLEEAGIAIVPNDAFEAVKKYANYICKRNGGDGCVREICELILDLD